MIWVAALLSGLREAAGWLCHQVTPKRLSDRELLDAACPIIWTLLALAGISALVFAVK